MIKYSVCATALLCAALAACGQAPEGQDADIADAAGSSEPDVAGAEAEAETIAVPDHEIQLPNGNALRFYLFEDGSAGVLEVGLDGNPSLLDLPEMEDATPAEVFLAVSAAQPVPEALLANHRAATVDGSVEAWEAIVEAAAPGWLLPELDTYLLGDFASSSSSCVNATFQANHCLPDAPYTNDKCFFDRSSNVSWISSLTRRYKAGVCVSAGFIHDKLSYQAVTGYCGGLQAPVVIWDQNYSAGGYTTWAWTAGFSDATRKWTHTATNAGAGDVFDHGQKWEAFTCVP
jgi:hypothetical protein